MIPFPITSRCPLKCVFCSHHGNLENLDVSEVSRDPLRILNRAKDIHNKVIIIGESATRTVEGEPFLFNDIFELLEILSKNNNSINITTSGVLLDMNKIKRLSLIKDLFLNISVNFLDPIYREKYLGDTISKNYKELIKIINEHSIDYSASLVALNIDDDFSHMLSTLDFLDQNGSIFNRVFIPGFTRINRKKILDVDLYRLESKLIPLRKNGVPIIIEPKALEDKVIVEGVIKNSPSHISGICFNDEIIKVDDIESLTTRDVFDRLSLVGKHKVEIKRDGQLIKKIIETNDSGSGIIFRDTPSSGLLEKISQSVSDKELIVTSKYSFDFFQKRLTKKNIRAVSCDYFGGNIQCNGLLTVQDISGSLKKGEFESILIDPSFLNNEDRDLLGQEIYQITLDKNINIKTI